jgi:hypothetical protein
MEVNRQEEGQFMATKTIKVPKMVNGVATGDVEEIQVED